MKGGVLLDKGINIKVDEELYRRIKVKIALEGKTLRNYILDLVLKDLGEQK